MREGSVIVEVELDLAVAGVDPAAIAASMADLKGKELAGMPCAGVAVQEPKQKTPRFSWVLVLSADPRRVQEVYDVVHKVMDSALTCWLRRSPDGESWFMPLGVDQEVAEAVAEKNAQFLKMKPMLGPTIGEEPMLVCGYGPFERDKKETFEGWTAAKEGEWKFDTRTLMDVVLCLLESDATKAVKNEDGEVEMKPTGGAGFKNNGPGADYSLGGLRARGIVQQFFPLHGKNMRLELVDEWATFEYIGPMPIIKDICVSPVKAVVGCKFKWQVKTTWQPIDKIRDYFGSTTRNS